MPSHSIQVARGMDGWRWELVDIDGATTAAGSAPDQDQAMQAAWNAALALADPAMTAYPEITIGRHGLLDLAA